MSLTAKSRQLILMTKTNTLIEEGENGSWKAIIGTVPAKEIPGHLASNGAEVVTVRFQTIEGKEAHDCKTFARRVNSIPGYTFSGVKTRVVDGYEFPTHFEGTLTREEK